MSSAEPTTTPEADEVEAQPVDTARDELVARFVERLGGDVVETHVDPGVDVWLRVSRDAWGRTAEVAKDLGFTYFCYVSAIDWMPSPYGKGEEAEPVTPPPADAPLETGVAGGDTRFQLLARLESPVTHLGVTFKADLPVDDLRAPTWSGVFPGADWHECETWEMFGITFDGHPGLHHLYLPGDFEGFPLRKDFPLISRMVKPWPGLVDVEPMPGEPEGDGDGEEAAES